MSTIHEYKQKIFEAQQHINAKRPFDKTQLQSLQKRFQIGFTYNSNAIEGNSYTLQEVKVLIEDGITVGGKPLRDQKETENHAKVTDILRNFVDQTKPLTESFILSLHQQLFVDVIDPQYLWVRRPIQVMITGEEQHPPSPKKIPDLIHDYLTFANTTHDDVLLKIARIHYDFVKIHPFVDGDGRVARLLMNLFLVQQQFLPIIFPVVVRNDYIASLNSQRSFDDFYLFFLRQLRENIKDYKRFWDNK